MSVLRDFTVQRRRPSPAGRGPGGEGPEGRASRGASPAATPLIAALLLLLLALPAGAEWKSGPRGEVFINLPAGWKILEVRDEKVTASNRAEEAFFILRYYDGDRFSGVKALDDFVRGELGAEASGGEQFDFAGRDAAYGEVEFTQGENTFAGMLLTVEDYTVDISAVAFTDSTAVDAYRDMLSSVLDSLSLGHSGIVQPGPLSRFHSPYPSQRDRLHSISFEGREVPVIMGRGEMERSQELIEREARLLSLYGGSELAVEAWRRYYRLLYRDLYARTAPIYTAVSHHVFEGEETDEEIARRLLKWVQGFEYRRLETMSDCLSPLTAAVETTGDCDSRGLLYLILLHYFDIEAILMVSSVYSHSMVGVDLEGEGARFPYREVSYLVAETTDDVELGRIDKNMSNINAWIGIDFIRFSGSTVRPR